MVKVTNSAGHATQYTYNRVGERLVETDANGHDATQAYDQLGRMISTTDRLGHTTTFVWNVLGLQASLTDAEDQTTSYVYDEFAGSIKRSGPITPLALSRVITTMGSLKPNTTN